MIITRTPFRFTLGGGGTDLPSYYKRYGGLVFAAAIDKYMYIFVNRPIVDDLVRVKYSSSESVKEVSELKHELAKAALEFVGEKNAIEIISMADIPAGTGLGSSSCYIVGLLGALFALRRDYRSVNDIAEMACHLEMDILKKPIGKQDQYLASYGGLPILEIDKEGKVRVRQVRIDPATMEELNRNTLLFYTGQSRDAGEILKHQDTSVKKEESSVIEAMRAIHEIGYKIVEAVESGNVDLFGLLMDEHWTLKRGLSPGISDARLEKIYDIAKQNGALGGKVTGAGGGGFFVLYTNGRHNQLRRAMRAEGLRELRYRFDIDGSKILVNFADGRSRYETYADPSWECHSDLGVSGTC